MQELIRRNKRRFMCLMGTVAVLVLFVVAIPSIPVVPVGAQGTTPTLDGSRDFDERIRTFFDQLKNGSTSIAFDNFLLNSPLGNASAGGSIADMRARFEEAKKNLFGEILDWEKHGSKRIGEDIVVVRYILKCEHYPMIWTFTFYRKPLGALSTGSSASPNPWNLIEMRFDSNLDLLAL